jgi:TolB-like protein/Tfp pilus assembly protein PilF
MSSGTSSGNFFAELKRRNVYKVAIAYAIVAWLLIQAASILFPTFEAPAWVMKVLVSLIILGFPVALIFAWAFEITPEGLKRAEDVLPDESIAHHTGRKLVWITVALAVIAAGLFAYQFLRPKTPTAPRQSEAATGSINGTTAIPEKSIAVLPFENLSRDPDNAFFTDGVQDQILTNLAQIAELKVISRTSVMQYKTGALRNLREIAQQLGVGRVVEGSVQRAGNRVRVTAQLLDARNDAHLWAQTYDRDLADVFAIQSEIAKAIADQLQAKLSPNEKKAIEQPPTSDVTAFDLYSRGKTLILTTSFSAMGAPNVRQAIELLNQAVARDPSFFLAQCELVRAHDNLYSLGLDHTPARLALGDAALAAALRLRPDAGDAHLARAGHLYRGYRDYDGALAELEIARRTLPNDPRVFELTGFILRRRGQREEGLRNLERAVELDPRNFYTLQQIALSYFMLRRYSEEAAILDRALSIKPDDADTKVTRVLIALEEKGDTRPLHQTLDEIRAKDPEAIKSVANNWLLCALAERDAGAAENALVALGDNPFGDDAVRLYRHFCEGLIARMTKDQARARAAFTAARAEQEKRVQAQPDYGPAFCVLGLIDAGLGRKEEALREGRRAIELLPVEKDSINGAHMIEYFAITAAWVGEKDLAYEQLAKALQVSGGFVSYGRLKLLPYWEPLRGDPRFEKIVASLAPKN